MFLFKEKIKNIINFGNKKKDFKVVTEEWLEYKKNTVKQSTYYNYSYSVEKYLYPEFAGKDITKIKNYNGFIENLSDTLAPKTVRDIITKLKEIINMNIYIKQSTIWNSNSFVIK